MNGFNLSVAWTEDTQTIMQLVRTDGVGPVTYQKLISRFSTPSEALSALPEIISKSGRKAPSIPSREAVWQEIEQTRQIGAQLIVFGSKLYPPSLLHLPDPPPVLTVLGAVELLTASTIGIVGARNASSAGLRITEQLAEAMAEHGWCIASGLARGIDGAAHRAALRKGTTLAALAGGINHFYPPEHRTLQNEIAQKGLLITEAPFGTSPQSQHFPRRNRLIAGLSLGCVIIEAAMRSGSLITARLALEYGRTVFAVPGSPLDPRSKGGNQLLRDGAVLVEDAEDILAELPVLSSDVASFRPHMLESPLRSRNQPRDIDQSTISPISSPDKNSQDFQENLPDVFLEHDEEAHIPYQDVLALLSATPVTVDELARACQRPAAAVIIALTELELSGRVNACAGGYALVPK